MEKRGQMLELLKKVQDKNKRVTEKDIKNISLELNIPATEVFSVASFYSFIELKARGKNIIRICNNPSCYLNGSMDIIKTIEQFLNVKSGETTKDKKFFLEICSCIGCCDKPPAMMINNKVYNNLTEEKVISIIKKVK